MAVDAAPLRPAWARLDRLSRFGAFAAIVVLFCVSGGMLWLVGYNYDGLTGGAATKIHPSTYLIVAVFGWSLVASGQPVRRLLHLANRRPAAALMVVIAVVVTLATVARGGPGLGGLVDTYVACGLLVLLLADADETMLARLERLLHVMMMANALLAVAEFLLQSRLFPYRFDGAIFETDTRSAGLHGHPLANAMSTACYLMALMNGARSLPTPLRAALIALQSAALVVFGGRTAALAALALGGAYGFVLLLGKLRGGGVPLLGAAAAFIVAALVPAAVGALAAFGFFDTLIGRFVEDGGSAEARKEMFALLAMFSWGDLILGPDTDLVDSLRRVQGLEWGIENPVVRLLLYQGAVVTIALLGAFVLLMRELIRVTRPGLWLPMIVWFILLNGAETIASKTTLPAKFAVIAIALYRPDRRATPIRAARTVRALRPRRGRLAA
jgi:hypothetical protein